MTHLQLINSLARRDKNYLLNTKIAPAKPLGIVGHTMIHGSKIRAELSPRTTRKDSRYTKRPADPEAEPVGPGIGGVSEAARGA
jgi:hypothetical protein